MKAAPRNCCCLVVAPKRRPTEDISLTCDKTTNVGTDLDLFDLFVIWRRGTIQERSHLCSEVCCYDKRAKDIPWKNVCERSGVVLDIVVGDIDVLQSKRKMCCRNGTHTPVRFTAEDLLLVIGG